MKLEEEENRLKKRKPRESHEWLSLFCLFRQILWFEVKIMKVGVKQKA